MEQLASARAELLGLETVAAQCMHEDYPGRILLQYALGCVKEKLTAAESRMMSVQSEKARQHVRHRVSREAADVLLHDIPVLARVLEFCGPDRWAYITRVSMTFHGVYMHVVAQSWGVRHLFMTAHRTAAQSQAMIDYARASGMYAFNGDSFCYALGATGSMPLIERNMNSLRSHHNYYKMPVNKALFVGLATRLDVSLLQQALSAAGIDASEACSRGICISVGLEAAASGDTGTVLSWVAQQPPFNSETREDRCKREQLRWFPGITMEQLAAARAELLGLETIAAQCLHEEYPGRILLLYALGCVKQKLTAAETRVSVQSQKAHHHVRQRVSREAADVLLHDIPVLARVLEFCGPNQWAYTTRVSMTFHGVYMHVVAQSWGVRRLFMTAHCTAAQSQAMIDYASASGMYAFDGDSFCYALGATGSMPLIERNMKSLRSHHNYYKMPVNKALFVGLATRLDVSLLQQALSAAGMDSSDACSRGICISVGLEAAASGDTGTVLKWVAQQPPFNSETREDRCKREQLRWFPAALMCKAAEHGHEATLQWLMDAGVRLFGPVAPNFDALMAMINYRLPRAYTWPENTSEFHVMTPLDVAVYYGQKRVVEWLRSSGTSSSSGDFTPHTMRMAVFSARTHMVDWLLERGCCYDIEQVQAAVRSTHNHAAKQRRSTAWLALRHLQSRHPRSTGAS
ncbi:hypothetical protein JKP88DRAFT_255311 [Tribonema minus]|uniref:Uncharacterized protein n=1 Tax=Tribonema minus TaxID=303371 RepID=A0A835YZM9_9STRA|nr:hypothetical protein JKP88DRAFT_255311 [Tribonema minus]